ncbi:hypothetical protein BDZ89DRAFT_1074683 [Hymenopellis radicata]|nr:hypothetical protein BDZ89DRAFT_1074683 [Hymenopellis radicata]
MDALSSDGTFDYHGVVAAFDTLVVIGFVMIAIVLVPAWRSSEIYRLKTWFALMIAGLVYSVSFFLIVGRQFGEEPAFGLCLLQASLIYGAPVLTSSFSLSFYRRMRGVGRGRRESSKWTGLPDHRKIVRNPSHVYCYATVSYPYYITGVVGLFTFLAVLVLEGIGLSAVGLISTTAFSPYWVLLFPTFCIVISIIFGTQKDILKFYRDLFVKRTKNRDSLRLIPDALEMPIRQSAKDDFLDV